MFKFTLPAGLVIYAVYKMISRYVKISETVSIILCVISIVLMLIGVAYHGWCFGKGKSPYAK